MSSSRAFLYSQLIFHPPVPTKTFTGQTVIVTGSNVGLGVEAARHFVRLDANKVILAVRNLEKGEAAKKSILTSEQREPDVIEVWKLDLSKYQSVKDFTARAQGLERLDVLVENAGILTQKWSMMEENESTITTNVVSQFLHAIPLLPKMRETALKFNSLPHLVFTTSFVQWLTQFPERKEDKIFEALADPKKARMSDRYTPQKPSLQRYTWSDFDSSYQIQRLKAARDLWRSAACRAYDCISQRRPYRYQSRESGVCHHRDLT